MPPHGISTESLLRTEAFQPLKDNLSLDERIEISYQRARAIGKHHALTLHDVLHLSPKFWDLHMDNIVSVDSGATTLLTIQYNLAAGTLAPFAEERPDLRSLMNDILEYNVSAQFLLTEIAHGLDAANIETTATLLPSGEFSLHTPNEGARKFMPPTRPSAGSIPRVGIVFAKLIVDGEDRGIRPFVVALGDGTEMCTGITSSLLPQRGGVPPVDHCVTSFDHVHIPAAALLGSLSIPSNHRVHFSSCIWRVGVGSLALSMCSIPALSIAAYMVGRYSQRRMVTRSDGVQVPIISFRTQQLPILLALAQVAVMKAYAQNVTQMYRDSSLDTRVKNGIAAAAKAVMTHHAWTSFAELSERIGAHGVFEYGRIIPFELAIRGTRIAEGDVLVLSIRLTNELLLGRYQLPKAKYPQRLLARHEEGLITECRMLLDQFDRNHRDERLNNMLLPQCLPLVRAIGHRMAYEAALDAQVDGPLVDLYEASVISLDPAWYTENAGVSRWKQVQMIETTATKAMSKFETYLAETGAAEYTGSPILTAKSWIDFLERMPKTSGNAELCLFPDAPH